MRKGKFFKGKKVLITLGATREHLDSVRFFSNASSGKMGLALAERFKALGASVFLVSGPGVSGADKFSRRVAVSARDMLREVQKRFRQCDFFVSVAAVADYRPGRSSPRKMPKSSKALSIKLVPNPDILASAAQGKTGQFCVGFALEDSAGVRKALEKMKRKNCDLMVLNSPRSMESDRIDATLLRPSGKVERLGVLSKKRCAEKICQAIETTISIR